MAQSTPTHASGFQLFTVAMTGHAEEWVRSEERRVGKECRSRCLRTVPMKQPTMYSYMASHGYLYQIIFNTSLSLPTQPFTLVHHLDEPDLTRL